MRAQKKNVKGTSLCWRNYVAWLAAYRMQVLKALLIFIDKTVGEYFFLNNIWLPLYGTLFPTYLIYYLLPYVIIKYQYRFVSINHFLRQYCSWQSEYGSNSFIIFTMNIRRSLIDSNDVRRCMAVWLTTITSTDDIAILCGDYMM